MRPQAGHLLATTLVSLLGATVSVTGWAQDNRIPSVTEEQEPGWRFTFTPELWMTGMAGRVGVGSSVSEVDLSFSDIFDQFHLGVTGVFEARGHPWVILTDLMYVSLSDEQALSVDGSGTLLVEQKDLMVQPELGYTIVSRPWGGIDALVGARYWHLSVDLTFAPTQLSGERNWIDGTVGARVRFQPAARWHLVAKSDVGAGGSDFSVQALGGVGYDVGQCCTLDAAYKYLSVDYEKDDLTYDVHLNGPAVGLTLHF